MPTGRYVPPESRTAEIVLQRVARGSFLLAVVLLIWLLVPIGRCLGGEYRAIRLGDAGADDAGEVDRDRVRASKGLFLDTVTAFETCHRRTPVLGQRGKSSAFLISGAIALTAWALGRLVLQHRRARLP